MTANPITQGAQPVNDNLELRVASVHCRHCGHGVGLAESPLEFAQFVRRSPGSAGSQIQIRNAVGQPVAELRQWLCPNCMVCLQTEIVPADSGFYRTSKLG